MIYLLWKFLGLIGAMLRVCGSVTWGAPAVLPSISKDGHSDTVKNETLVFSYLPWPIMLGDKLLTVLLCYFLRLAAERQDLNTTDFKLHLSFTGRGGTESPDERRATLLSPDRNFVHVVIIYQVSYIP